MRGVAILHAEIERAVDDSHGLGVMVGMLEQALSAEAEERDLDPGSPEGTPWHRRSRRGGAGKSGQRLQRVERGGGAQSGGATGGEAEKFATVNGGFHEIGGSQFSQIFTRKN